jgi:hypothetical protein
MKRLALVFLLLAGNAWAQPPEILEPEDRIELGVGESRTLKFEQPFKSWDSAIPDIVKLLPQSDRQLTVTGTALGTTLMFIHDEQGSVIYTATVSVLPSAGHLVKIYGNRRGRSSSKDFVSYFCTETGCGRADTDKPEDPTVLSITQTRPSEGGGSDAVTRQYGPN